MKIIWHIIYIYFLISWFFSLLHRSFDDGKHGGLQQIVARLMLVSQAVACTQQGRRNISFRCYRSLVDINATLHSIFASIEKSD